VEKFALIITTSGTVSGPTTVKASQIQNEINFSALADKSNYNDGAELIRAAEQKQARLSSSSVSASVTTSSNQNKVSGVVSDELTPYALTIPKTALNIVANSDGTVKASSVELGSFTYSGALESLTMDLAVESDYSKATGQIDGFYAFIFAVVVTDPQGHSAQVGGYQAMHASNKFYQREWPRVWCQYYDTSENFVSTRDLSSSDLAGSGTWTVKGLVAYNQMVSSNYYSGSVTLNFRDLESVSFVQSSTSTTNTNDKETQLSIEGRIRFTSFNLNSLLSSTLSTTATEAADEATESVPAVTSTNKNVLNRNIMELESILLTSIPQSVVTMVSYRDITNDVVLTNADQNHKVQSDVYETYAEVTYMVTVIAEQMGVNANIHSDVVALVDSLSATISKALELHYSHQVEPQITSTSGGEVTTTTSSKTTSKTMDNVQLYSFHLASVDSIYGNNNGNTHTDEMDQLTGFQYFQQNYGSLATQDIFGLVCVLIVIGFFVAGISRVGAADKGLVVLDVEDVEHRGSVDESSNVNRSLMPESH